MHDNKVRLSPDVLEKAEHIAAEWGLKNARAAVEAVFRKYCDDYLHGRPSLQERAQPSFSAAEGSSIYGQTLPAYGDPPTATAPPCDAIDAINQLLAL